ncbi:MAG: S8 family serine peptidase, partial [Chloroflexi bacterium]|nr:S8 family serine peptidase [Chloroflexota bacterium]
LGAQANVVQAARVIVEASTGYGPGSPFSLSCAEGLASSSCKAYENRVEFTRAQSASGTFDVGGFTLAGMPCAVATGCERDVVVTLVDAQGLNAAGAPATFSAPAKVTDVRVVPDVTWDLRVAPVAPYANKFAADIVLKPAAGVSVTSGTATITFPETTNNRVTAACDATSTAGVTCSVATPTVTFTISANPGLTSDQNGSGVSLGKVTFTAGSGETVNAHSISATVTASSVITAQQSTANGRSRLTENLQAVVDGRAGGQVGVRSVGGGVSVTIIADRDIRADLIALGATPGAHTPNHVHTATVPVGALVAVAEIPGVSLVSTQPDYKPRLDQSVKAVHAVDASGNRLTNPAGGVFDGAGTIVAVIDTGIDFTHEDFRNAVDGTSRILAIWNQAEDGPGTTAITNNDPARSAPVFAGGYVCTRAQINLDLTNNTSTNCPHQDTNGHGTHVASIAAGKFGVAPKADILVVNSIGTKGGDPITAFQWVVAMAAQAGKPVSVNNSWGGHSGPHDGSDAASLAIDGYAALPGVVMMVAAGNEGQMKLHASGNGTSSIGFVPQGTTSNINVWYDKADNFSVSVKQATRATQFLAKGPIANQAEADALLPNASLDLNVTVRKFSNCATNYATYCLITVSLAGLTAEAPEWSIEIKRNGETGTGQWHAWVADENSAEFVTPDYRVTLDEPAVA